METLIEKYGRYLELLRKNQEEMKLALIELGTNELTREEREYMNALMDYIGYTNTSISLTERTVERLNKKNEYDELSQELTRAMML